MRQILADIIIRNGRVLTVNQNNEIAEAVAIRGNQILAVGTNAELEAYQGPDTQVIDAEGKSVLPGFIDSHIHVGMFGLLDHGIINVAYPKVHSIADIQRLILRTPPKRSPASGSSSMVMTTTSWRKSAIPPRRSWTLPRRTIRCS